MIFSNRSNLLNGGCFLVASFVFSTAVATAQEVYQFSIPRGDLSAVLTQIARTGHGTISMPAKLVEGRVAGPVEGTDSLRNALKKALAGTGLTVDEEAGRSFTIRPLNGSQATTNGESLDGDIAAIDVTDMNSTAFSDRGFRAGNAGESIRIGNAPIKDVPISVSAVTHDTITSQGLTTTTDAVRNVAGVTVLQDSGVRGFTQGGTNFKIRGFTSSDPVVNGQKGIRGSRIPIDAVDRVEVLKGPTSILTGESYDGGAVNIVLKKPTDETIRDLTVRYGTDQYKTVALDLGGVPLDLDGVTYRFVSSATHSAETEAGYEDPNQFMVAPSVQWEGEKLTVSAGVSYIRDKQVPSGRFAYFADNIDPGTGDIISSQLFKAPGGFGYGNPRLHTNVETLGFETEQTYDAGQLFDVVDVSFNNKFQYTKGSVKGYDFSIDNSNFGYVQDFTPSFNDLDYSVLTARPSTTFSYEGDILSSTFKIGFDYQKTTSDVRQAFGTTGSIDLLTGNPRIPLWDLELEDGGGADVTNKGIYAVEKLDLFDDRLHLLGSARRDWNVSVSRTFGAPEIGKSNGNSFVLGAAFDVTDDLSLYVNKSKGFVPQSPIFGEAVQPQGRDLKEVGARYEMLGGDFALSGSFYDLTQTNVTLVDLSGPSVVLIPTAGMRSRGIEIEAQGEILPGWNLTLSGSRLNAKRLSDDAGFDPSAGNPRLQGNVWTTYTFQDGWAEGLTLGAGIRAVSDSKVSAGNNRYYDLAGYAVADLMIGYKKDTLSADLKINNVFDTQAVTPSVLSSAMAIEKSRSVVLTLKKSF